MELENSYFVLVPLLCIIAIFGVFYIRLKERKRSRVLEELALRMAFSFSPKDNHSLLNQLGKSFLYYIGYDRRRIYNLMQRTQDSLKVAIFDFHYYNGGSGNKRLKKQTVSLFQSEHLNLPSFKMIPENFLVKILSKLGYQDIDFNDFPEFSRRYLLRGKVEAQIRDLFKNNVLSYFNISYGWCVEGSGNILVVYRDGKIVEPEKIQEYFEETRGIFNLFQ